MPTVARSDPLAGPWPGTFEAWLAAVLLGDHPSLREARAFVQRAARADLPVLVLGETGTGKDIVARAVHRGSARGTRKLSVVSLGGLGDTAWSVLFGHRRGAFTGSVGDHDGVFSAAHRSSLLFDDVDTAPSEIQPMLLRATETGYYRPLGASQEKHCDVRILTTSNADLGSAISEGRFRADLYQRLSVLRIMLPPLRERRSDLGILVPHFLAKAEAMGHGQKSVTADGMKALRKYPWPGNVRELEHVLYRAAVETPGPRIDASVLKGYFEGAGSMTEREGAPGLRSQVGAEELENALLCAQGNKREAARSLGISPNRLYKLIREYGIRPPKRMSQTIIEAGRDPS